VVKVIRQKARIPTAHGWLNRICQMAPMCILCNTSFLEPTRVHTQTAPRSVQAFLHRSRQTVPILYNRPPLPAQNCCFTRDLVPSVHASSQSLQLKGILKGSAAFAGLTTVTVRPTYRRRCSISNNTLHLHCVVLQCGLK